jgi:hypothetical protein
MMLRRNKSSILLSSNDLILIICEMSTIFEADDLLDKINTMENEKPVILNVVKPLQMEM